MSEGTTRVTLGLGSNLGDRFAALQGGVDGWEAVVTSRVVAVSGVYESAAVGGPKQPDYLNAVMIIETGLPVEQVLEKAQGIERRWRRDRTVRWGPRTLDIDILSYGTTAVESERLTLPHPRAAQRWFVMLPWAEVDGDSALRIAGPSAAPARRAATVRSTLSALRLADPGGEQACVKRSDLALRLPEPHTLGP